MVALSIERLLQPDVLLCTVEVSSKHLQLLLIFGVVRARLTLSLSSSCRFKVPCKQASGGALLYVPALNVPRSLNMPLDITVIAWSALQARQVALTHPHLVVSPGLQAARCQGAAHQGEEQWLEAQL